MADLLLLPNDMHNIIFGWIDANSIFNLRLTCTKMLSYVKHKTWYQKITIYNPNRVITLPDFLTHLGDFKNINCTDFVLFFIQSRTKMFIPHKLTLTRCSFYAYCNTIFEFDVSQLTTLKLNYLHGVIKKTHFARIVSTLKNLTSLSITINPYHDDTILDAFVNVSTLKNLTLSANEMGYDYYRYIDKCILFDQITCLKLISFKNLYINYDMMKLEKLHLVNCENYFNIQSLTSLKSLIIEYKKNIKSLKSLDLSLLPKNLIELSVQSNSSKNIGEILCPNVVHYLQKMSNLQKLNFYNDNIIDDLKGYINQNYKFNV